MDQRNWSYYHMWRWNIYLVDPTGDAIQMDACHGPCGPTLDPKDIYWGDNAPEFRTIAEDDALENTCTQGNCGLVQTSAKCSAGLDKVLERCGISMGMGISFMNLANSNGT